MRVESQEALRLVNTLLCTAGETRFGTRVDHGPYVAKVMLSTCFPNSNRLQDVANAPTDITVDAVKATEDAVLARLWFVLPASYLAIEAVPTVPPEQIAPAFLDLSVNLRVTKAPTADNPLGLLKLSYEARLANTVVWQGVVSTELAGNDGDVLLKVYDQADVNFVDQMGPEPSAWTDHVLNHVSMKFTRKTLNGVENFAGKGHTSSQHDWIPGSELTIMLPPIQSREMGLTTADIAFDTQRIAARQFFLRPDMPPGETTDVCKQRRGEFGLVKRYAAIDATGTMLPYQSIYPLVDKATGETKGWLNYERTKLPDDAADASRYFALLRDGSRVEVQFRTTDGLLYRRSNNPGIAARDLTPFLTSNLTLACISGCPVGATHLTFDVSARKLLNGDAPVAAFTTIELEDDHFYIPKTITSNSVGILEVVRNGALTGEILTAPPPLEFVGRIFANAVDSYVGSENDDAEGLPLSQLGLKPFFDGFSVESLFMSRSPVGVGYNLPVVVFSSKAEFTSATDAPPLIRAGDKLHLAPLTTDLLPRDAPDCSADLQEAVDSVAADASLALPTSALLPLNGTNALNGPAPTTMTGEPVYGGL